MDDLTSRLTLANSEGKLLDSSLKNISDFLISNPNPLYISSVEELAQNDDWDELNDRFYKCLSFGTGGLRGRTIGRNITKSEQGSGGPNDRPEHPCIGSNAMNNYNLNRATRGLVYYLQEWLKNEGSNERVRIVFCYDTRHFSKDFAELCADIAAKIGAEVHLFDSHKATPVMSFAIRELHCHAGVMITASHNPYHDNGYKVNFSDGAAIVPPHTQGIIERVNNISTEQFEPLPSSEQGTVSTVHERVEAKYLDRVKSLVLQPNLVNENNSLKIVFTALHGTGGVHIPQLLSDLGFKCETVHEQDSADGRFPTVDSPNPENGPALKMGIDLAESNSSDLVIGTDPDCDRMGVAVRGESGKMELLTGNQIGSLLLYYRIKTLFELNILNEQNRHNSVVIKTFVTTELQRSIAEEFGIKVIDTLTGFKYISQKLGAYERSLPDDIYSSYKSLSVSEAREVQLGKGTFFIFGGEESYGYLACDFTRDKDANSAAVLFAETAAFANSKGMSLIQLLDNIYCEFGYYKEMNTNKVFEGADGAECIASLIQSYSTDPPINCDGSEVIEIINFADETIKDAEGDLIPKEKMLFIELKDGRRFAVRPSGTEPKIKYYFYGHASREQIQEKNLDTIKSQTSEGLNSLWEWIQEDIQKRVSYCN